jgi:hypothetical protein
VQFPTGGIPVFREARERFLTAGRSADPV